jgi:DNA mismatch endonuclease, patch repair protein
MVDIVDRATRSRMMASIRGKDTRPELLLRRALHSRGFRYRLHARSLPGRPDLVLPRWRAVVFVHGCFWHRHSGCRYATTPATRPEFWQAKFDANVARDARSMEALEAQQWRVAIVWECAQRSKSMDEIVTQLAEWLRSGQGRLELPPKDP